MTCNVYIGWWRTGRRVPVGLVVCGRESESAAMNRIMRHGGAIGQ